MDFLPVNSSLNQRLKYTQSYALPEDVRQIDKPTYFEQQKQTPAQVRSQDNSASKLNQQHFEPISSKNDITGLKVRQDIDDYIKRRSQKGTNDSSNTVVNRSSQNLNQSNHQINKIKPTILESKVENIIISESGSFKKIAPPMAETNDNMELPIIKETDLDRLDSSKIFDSIPEVYESRRQSTVVPLHRKLQQSSVNVNLESQVRSYAHPIQLAQSINDVEGITQELNSKNAARQHTRNIQKYELNPIIQHEKQNVLFEPEVDQKRESPIEVINIPELYSNSGYKQVPKQLYKRNFVLSNEPEANSMNHYEIIELPRQQQKINPMIILNESVRSRDNITLKRNLQQSNKIQNGIRQIIIASQQSGELSPHYNGIPLERSLVMEKPQDLKDIFVEVQNHSQSLNNSKQIKQKRDLQRQKLEQSVPIELSQILNENSINSRLTNSLKRQLQHTEPQKPIQIQLEPSNQNFINETSKSSLKRHLEHQLPQQPLKIQIQSSNQYYTNQKLKSSLKRHLEQPLPQEPISIYLGQSNQNMGNQVLKSSLKRSLQNPRVQRQVPIQVQYQQNQHSLDQSQRSTLKRRIQAPIHEQAINIELQHSNEYSLRQSVKSTLRRNLEALPQQQLFKKDVEHPIRVQLAQSHQQSLNNSLKSSLRRKLDAPVRIIQQPIKIQIQPYGEQRMQKSNSKLLKRTLEHPYQEQKQSDRSIKQQKINNHQVIQELPLNDPHNDSIHLSERLQTIETPKNIAMQRRDLKLNSLPHANPQPPVDLNKASQRVIQGQSNKVISEPEPMRKSIHINFDPCEEYINSKSQPLAKRNLKTEAPVLPEKLPEKLPKICDQGWNSTKHIFNLFKIPATTKNTGQISFTKSRINTSSLLH